MRQLLKAFITTAAATLAFAATAQPIKIANIVELSGAGATSGTNFKNGVELAVKEINAAGGILGRKIVTTTSDTQSNPGVAKGLTAKAVDDGAFAIFGPDEAKGLIELKVSDIVEHPAANRLALTLLSSIAVHLIWGHTDGLKALRSRPMPALGSSARMVPSALVSSAWKGSSVCAMAFATNSGV